MKEPMTSDQAIEKFQCESCKAGNYCGFECTLSRTCSFLCNNCRRGIYYEGDTQDAPEIIVCPHCGAEKKNEYRRKPN